MSFCPTLPADEIMHQDLSPLCAADIQEQLKKRFAYLSGECRAGQSVGVCSGRWLASLGLGTRLGGWGHPGAAVCSAAHGFP